MRYFFISDVHGNYEKMVAALEANHFNKEKDTLVSVGDPFDRGPKSKEVLEYIMSCPNRILLWGNHDRRLYLLLNRSGYSYNYYDYQNGVLETLISFAGNRNEPIEECLRKLQKNKLLTQYFNECCYAIEFDDLIATHAWLPFITKNCKFRTPKYEWQYMIDPDWRDYSPERWYDALWSNSQNLAQLGVFPEKTLLIGHWHAWRFREKFDKVKMIDADENIIDSSTYTIADKLIAIDGCASYDRGGQVNVYIYQNNNQPIKYPIYQK